MPAGTPQHPGETSAEIRLGHLESTRFEGCTKGIAESHRHRASMPCATTASETLGHTATRVRSKADLWSYSTHTTSITMIHTERVCTEVPENRNHPRDQEEVTQRGKPAETAQRLALARAITKMLSGCLSHRRKGSESPRDKMPKTVSVYIYSARTGGTTRRSWQRGLPSTRPPGWRGRRATRRGAAPPASSPAARAPTAFATRGPTTPCTPSPRCRQGPCRTALTPTCPRGLGSAGARRRAAERSRVEGAHPRNRGGTSERGCATPQGRGRRESPRRRRETCCRNADGSRTAEL